MKRSEIRQARPSYRTVNPIIYYLSWFFVLLNIFFLAPSFFFLDGGRGLVLISDVTPPFFWGVVFTLTGLALAYGLLNNDWKLQRAVLKIGLFIKTLWAYALALTLFGGLGTIGVIGLWFFLMATQSLCIIFFNYRLVRWR